MTSMRIPSLFALALALGACSDSASSDASVDASGSDAALMMDASTDASLDARASDADVDANVSVPVGFIDLRVEEISSTRAVVRFDTSRPTSCEAEYGLAMDALSLTATDPNMEPGELSATHEVPLEDLTPDTVYYYRAKVVDAAEQIFRSETLSFRTAPDSSATRGPNVALLSAGSSISDVSSNYGGAANDMTWGANAAIDGMMTTEWSSAGDGDAAFLEVDCGGARTLAGFGFRSRKMTDGTSIIQMLRLVFADGSTLGPYSTPDPDQIYRFDFPAPVNTTRVRVQAVMTTGGNTGIKEVELYEAM